MAAQKRVSKELSDLTKFPPPGVTVSLTDEANLFDWSIVMEGPAGSPYSGGTFNLKLELPPDYPFKPPTVRFTTKIFHPNISNDSPPNSGTMCLGMLKADQWKPSTKLNAVIEFTRQLLKEPNPEDAVEAKIADLYRQDKAGFEKEARDWTKRYAIKK